MEKAKPFLLVIFCAVVAFFGIGASAEESGETMDSSAKSAVLIERQTGRILLRCNENQPLPMASTTKVMTALMALEYGKLDEVVTVGRNAYGVPGTSIYLGLGERITLRDLIYGLMLASGNDAAVAIAEHIGGDVDTFCQRMTERARALGCEKTVFVNPNGLPVAGHQTTAYELALIAREAMGHELFRSIVSTQRGSIPWEGRSYDRVLRNKNRLLSEYEGATGIKTGYTKAAGRCLVFGARRDGLEVIGVVLNCGDWFEEAKRIMDRGFATYEAFTALGDGEVVRVVPLENGQEETAYLCTQQALQAPVRKGQVPVLELDVPESVRAGTPKDTVVGEARLILDGEIIAAVPLVTRDEMARRDYGFELERMLRTWPLYQSQSIAD